MKICKPFQKYKHYATETENPFIQIFYIIIGPIAYIFYAYYVYYQKYHVIGVYNLIIANIISFVAFYNYIMTWKTDPGTITTENHAPILDIHKDHFDGHTFIKNQNCTTCNLIK